jgi:hypothetical protein
MEIVGGSGRREARRRSERAAEDGVICRKNLLRIRYMLILQSPEGPIAHKVSSTGECNP